MRGGGILCSSRATKKPLLAEVLGPSHDARLLDARGRRSSSAAAPPSSRRRAPTRAARSVLRVRAARGLRVLGRRLRHYATESSSSRAPVRPRSRSLGRSKEVVRALWHALDVGARMQSARGLGWRRASQRGALEPLRRTSDLENPHSVGLARPMSGRWGPLNPHRFQHVPPAMVRPERRGMLRRRPDEDEAAYQLRVNRFHALSCVSLAAFMTIPLLVIEYMRNSRQTTPDRHHRVHRDRRGRRRVRALRRDLRPRRPARALVALHTPPRAWLVAVVFAAALVAVDVVRHCKHVWRWKLVLLWSSSARAARTGPSPRACSRAARSARSGRATSCRRRSC